MILHRIIEGKGADRKGEKKRLIVLLFPPLDLDRLGKLIQEKG